MSLRPNFSGSPPTLWWDLMVSRMPPPDSIQSGAMVPCIRYSASTRVASSSKTRMNSSPMMCRFRSGSSTPSNFRKNRSEA